MALVVGCVLSPGSVRYGTSVTMDVVAVVAAPCVACVALLALRWKPALKHFSRLQGAVTYTAKAVVFQKLCKRDVVTTGH